MGLSKISRVVATKRAWNVPTARSSFSSIYSNVVADRVTLWISWDHVNHHQFSEASLTWLIIRVWVAVHVFLCLKKHGCLRLVTTHAHISPLWQPKATTKPHTICQRLHGCPGVSSKGSFHPLHALYTALLLGRKMGIWKAVDLPALPPALSSLKMPMHERAPALSAYQFLSKGALLSLLCLKVQCVV